MSSRWPIALLLALAGHVLLLGLPLPQQRLSPPLTGHDSIHISLAPAGSVGRTGGSAKERRTTTAPSPPSPVQTRQQPAAAEGSLPRPTVDRFQQKSEKQRALPHIMPLARKKKIAAHLPDQPGSQPDSPADRAPEPNRGGAERAATDTGSSLPSVVEAVPLYRDNPRPPYPSLARRRGWQGTVLLRVLVSADGRAQGVWIQRSSGFTLLDSTARKTVATWQFQPGSRDGTPVAMEVLVPVHFRLE